MLFLKKIKKINKWNILTVVLFLSTFLFSIVDMKTLELFSNLIRDLVWWKFWISYILMSYILLKTATFFMKMSVDLQITVDSTIKNKILKSFKLLAVGYYIGLLVNISNSFVLIVFERYLV